MIGSFFLLNGFLSKEGLFDRGVIGYLTISNLLIFLPYFLTSLALYRFVRKSQRERDFSRSLINSNLDGILAFDKQMTYTVWNGTMEKISGFPAKQVLGKKAPDLFPQIKETGTYEIIRRVLQGEVLFISEREFIHQKTGEKRYYEGNWSPIYSGNKNVIGGLAVIRDITSKKSTETEQGQFFHQSLDAICVAGLDGYFKKVNPALENIAGYSSEELLLHPFMDLIYPEDRPQAAEQLAKLGQGEPVLHFECRMVRKDGSLRWLEWKASAVGQTIYASARDLTSKKEDERKILEQQQALIYSSKLASLGEMAGGIAHEINTPLAVLEMNASFVRNMIEKGKLDPFNAKKSFRTIENTVFRIAAIIRGLRFFARDGREDPLERVLVKSLVDNAIELCQEFLKNKGIELKRDKIPGSLEVLCRPVQISQVILNLINNSRDAIEHLNEKWIKIEVEEQQDALVLSVIDSGSGIPTALQPKLMQPFFTTKEVGKGTGLGLSISKGIVEEHGGTLSLDASCKNTRFLISLPKQTAKKWSSLHDGRKAHFDSSRGRQQ